MTKSYAQNPIFSTYVEVFLNKSCRCYGLYDFLHVCGGVSIESPRGEFFVKFSPRMWRCFLSEPARFAVADIFSTYVEVFLKAGLVKRYGVNFLHVCGGVSMLL